jgi:hypothetical protein
MPSTERRQSSTKNESQRRSPAVSQSLRWCRIWTTGVTSAGVVYDDHHINLVLLF